MEIVGYIAAVFIGITLGLIGSGGSILTVPVLVYLFDVDAVIATSYSLFIVGLTSAVGSFSYLKRKMINGKVVALFGIPSIISVILTRNFVVPAIPSSIINIGSLHISKDVLMLLLFGILMIAAAYGMIKNKKPVRGAVTETVSINWTLLIGHGFFVGFITGLIGAGGGFLIIPALVMLLKIPMKDAVGNSLVIIAANSFIGFFNSHNHDEIDWYLLFTVAALAIAGIFIGIRLSKNVEGSKLKPAFGWFILCMGFFIILRETLFRH
ncbi:MAG: sulfite exporter TauE/SafE family protein [Sphingobacteriales bacterium]|nr:MAG: sulfite exporter TauE/SafE family protein [Sphingobacteriales bacterium]